MEEKEKNINEVDASQKKKKHKGITLLILILIIGGVGYLNGIPVTVLAQSKGKTLEENIKKNALPYLKERTDYFSGIMGLEPTGVKITSAKKRFGSCSAKNSICYSWRLMLYSKEAIDYVVVHELAHIAHKNHGPQFYALIEKYLPDYKEREKLLR